MQDSLEDYVRISRNTKIDQKKISQEFLITAQYKIECDKKAKKIVEFCIEGKLRSQVFLSCLSFIDQAHYQDIVEERALSKLCGYPICGKRIPEMPKKQFHISMKCNKVYDITDRKNYCSNHCYKASIHVKNQIDTSPLWLRKPEMNKFVLLPKDGGGLPGVAIDQGIIKPVLNEQEFTSISEFTEVSLGEMEENEMIKDEPKTSGRKSVRKLNKSQTMQTIDEDSEDKPEINREDNKAEEKRKKSIELQPEKPTINIEDEVLKCLKEWLTIESLIFVHGENKVKAHLDAHKLSAYFDQLRIAELEMDQQQKYMAICKKLQMKELAEEKFDQALMGNKPLKPLPDFKQLKQESRDMDLKVKSYYSGDFYVKENVPAQIPKKKNGEVAEEKPMVLPLIDSNSQKALRRKIYLNSINKTMQTLLNNLRIPSSRILADLQNLVKTFELKATNIVFKPQTWDLIAVILLEILSRKDPELKANIEEAASREYLDLHLNFFQDKARVFSETNQIIDNIDYFVENFIVSK